MYQGRVQAGICWRMYTEEHLCSEVVEEYPIPEIRRIPIEEVILQVVLCIEHYEAVSKKFIFFLLCLSGRLFF
jgi:HrpA-like RNA helicase